MVSVPVVARDGAEAHLDGVEVEVVVVVVLHAQVDQVDAVGEEALLDGVNADHGGGGGDGVTHDISCALLRGKRDCFRKRIPVYQFKIIQQNYVEICSDIYLASWDT